MTLELPQDAECFIPNSESFEYLHNAGVYCLRLSRPDDLAEVWDREFDARPDYFEELQSAERVLYVGEAGDVLRRLEEHRDGDTRVGVLQRVCSIKSLRNIWFCESKEKAEREESRLAIMLQNEKPDWYIHSR